MSREALLDPQSCQQCHPTQFTDWAGSMHAYAADDPVFIAMNKRGQRETGGALGSFCIGCHAPMAVREGATTDGLNLDSVPRKLKGVTCFFCHSVESVEGTHNNPIKLAEDNALRAWIADPLNNTAHESRYSPHMDRDRVESAALCGSCHDVQTSHGASIERTFGEWKASVFSKPPAATTCAQCHMQQSVAAEPVARYEGAPTRRTHAHTFAGVDVALTPFGDTARQHALIQSFLDATLQSAVCLETQAGSRIKVIVDNVAAGHSFPSGVSEDRRLWVEVVAYAGATVVYQSGVVPLGASPTETSTDDRWVMRDCVFDDGGSQVAMFWDAASYESNTLPALMTLDSNDPRFYQTHFARTYPPNSALAATPDRITLRVLLQPIGLDVIDDLIASGDLTASIRDSVPTFEVGESLEWNAVAATESYLDHTTGAVGHCVTATNLNVQAETTPAVLHTRCSP